MSENTLVKLQYKQARRILAATNVKIAAGTFNFFAGQTVAQSALPEMNQLPDGMLPDAARGYVNGIHFFNATKTSLALTTAAVAVATAKTWMDLINHAIVTASVSGVQFVEGPLKFFTAPNSWGFGNFANAVADAAQIVEPGGWSLPFGRHPFAERAQIAVQVYVPEDLGYASSALQIVLGCALQLQTHQPLA